MDFQGHKDREYLLQYYAGQALVGLLAHSGLSITLAPDINGVTTEEEEKEGADDLATLAYNIAGAMVRAADKRF